MGILYARVSGAWVPVTSSPPTAQDRWYSAWGVVGTGSFTFSGATVGTPGAAATQALSVTTVAGRRYRIRCIIWAASSSTAVAPYLTLNEDGVLVGHRYNNVLNTGYNQVHGDWMITPAAGTHSYVVLWQGPSGVTIDSTYSQYYIEDVGPVTGTAVAAPTQDRWFNAWGIVAAFSQTPAGSNTSYTMTPTYVALMPALSFTATTGRRYRIVLKCRALGGPGTSANLTFALSATPTVALWGDDYVSTSVDYNSFLFEHILDGDGVTRSIVPSGRGSNGAPYLYPTFFYIEDVGPVTGASVIPSVTVTSWVNMTPMSNNWVSYGGGYQTCQYRKVGDIVYMRGLMSGGTAGSAVVYVLPSGFRPPAALQFATQGAGQFAWISVGSDGVFRAEGGTAPININCDFSVTT